MFSKYNKNMAEYIPGVCNIGPEEIKNRRATGILWSVISIGFLGLLFLINANPFWRLITFFPAFIAFNGFYQAYFHFCAGYGNRGLYNVAKSVGKYDTVERTEFRKKDKRKAQQILVLSLLTAAIFALLITFVF